MSDLTKLIQLCNDFNINTDDVDMQGEHDVIYLHFNKQDLLKLPHTSNDGYVRPGFKECEEILETTPEDDFAEKYGIFIVEEDSWGFYT